MKPLRKLAAGTLLAAALATSSLTLTGTAVADDTQNDTGTVTEPAGDTWWGSQPADGTVDDSETTARPAADTWWG